VQHSRDSEVVAEFVGFGTLFIWNPDLPERFKNNWPLTPGD
jgi:N-ethylmaleimide reductase